MVDRRAIGGFLIAAALASTAKPSAGQDWRTMALSRQISGQERLDVELNHAAGTLHVEPAEGPVLYAMDLRYDADVFDPIAAFDGHTLSLGVEGRGREIRLKKDGQAADMKVSLSTRVPLGLSLEFGAGRAEVDLGGLRLTDLDIQTGASETHLDVSRPNPELLERAHIAVGAAQFEARRIGNLNARRLSVEAGVGEVTLDLSGALERDLDIEVEMGLGALELRIPRGVGVKLVKESFLTDLDADDMERDGDAWYSRDWSSAERRVTIDVQAAFGSIDVVWLR